MVEFREGEVEKDKEILKQIVCKKKFFTTAMKEYPKYRYSDFIEVMKSYGIISEQEKTVKELTVSKWLDNKPKLEIRYWTKDRNWMGRSFPIDGNKIQKLKVMLKELPPLEETKNPKRRTFVNGHQKGGLLKFEILAHIGEIGNARKDWKQELNIVRWDDGVAKYDIRDWSPDHTRMGKGMTFTADEIERFKDLLNAIPEEELGALYNGKFEEYLAKTTAQSNA